MGREAILEKLNKELSKEIQEECQVIYILSRIRKYLEQNNKKSKYKVLNFYCNWALHSKMERTEPVAGILRDFITANGEGFKNFGPFLEELNKFLKAYDLSREIISNLDNRKRFLNLLIDIYEDTPLEVYPEEKRIITIKKSKTLPKDGYYSVDFKIE